MIKEYFDGMASPIGRLHIVVSDNAVLRIYLPNETWSERYVRRPHHPLIVRTKRELKEYFNGKRKKFTVPLEGVGTSFQKRAWAVLRRVPYGTTLTYTDEAHRAGVPTSVRAIANANGANPLPILVPCHRILPRTGGIGGYRGGQKAKMTLLELERRSS